MRARAIVELAAVGLTLTAMASLPGCGNDQVVHVGAPVKPSAAATGQPSQAEQGEPDGGLPHYPDSRFVEVDIKNRDPFRSFASTFKIEAPAVVQRKVVMPDTTVEQMRLTAIITGVPQPRAMLTDPDGVGHIVKRGDYVGRAEVVQAGGADGMPVTLNWRIDRIRPNEVVLTREDPTAPNRPPLTRVLALYQANEKQPGESPIE